MAVVMKRSTKSAPVSLSTSYLMGSAFIGISMITLNSSGALAPGVTLCRLMGWRKTLGENPHSTSGSCGRLTHNKRTVSARKHHAPVVELPRAYPLACPTLIRATGPCALGRAPPLHSPPDRQKEEIPLISTS